MAGFGVHLATEAPHISTNYSGIFTEVGMSNETFKYDMMVEEALRGVVVKALNQAVTEGLPGEHHFNITFKTNRNDVDIPLFLKERYSDEMTIVLEHQFWDLKIHDNEFEVVLSFNDKKERLLIPFDAIIAFSDPSVKFGLQFHEIEIGEIESANSYTIGKDRSEKSEVNTTSPGEIVSLDKFRNKNNANNPSKNR